jgi:polyhydroxyalkanoate synthesis repressor PhaR
MGPASFDPEHVAVNPLTRTIKKYANRRLYDTSRSRYITLNDLKGLIVSGESVRIVDAKSRANITREVLLQLVAEQESLGRPILSESVLTALIRFYGHPLQQIATRYLESALGLLQSQQRQLTEQMRGLLESPVDLAGKLTRQNVEWLKQMQKGFLDALNPASGRGEKPDEEPG